MIPFLELTQKLMDDAPNGRHCYLLIDAAQQNELIEEWLQSEPKPAVRSLFEGTLEGELPLYASALLLELSPKTIKNMNTTVTDWLNHAAMVNVLSATLNLDELIKHIQPFLEAKLPSGEQALFRLFDPTVAKLMFDMLSKEHYIKLFMPIPAWWVANDDGLFERLPNLKGRPND